VVFVFRRRGEKKKNREEGGSRRTKIEKGVDRKKY
jgi:hypothetical protein